MFNFCLLLLVICKLAAGHNFDPLSDAYIDHLNKQGKWKAGRNFHQDTPMSYLKNLMGANLNDPGLHLLPRLEHDSAIIASLPESFDPREKWPNCPSLNEIRDQGSCGSCWAFSATETMTDRVCTYSNGTQKFHFSAEDLLSCSAESVGTCHGGIPSEAWRYWVDVGLVSGGNYGSNEGCRPYSMPMCEHHTQGNLPNCTDILPTPACVKECQSGYSVPYAQDIRRGKLSYAVKREENIKAELFKNGPVDSSFSVYDDFLHYKDKVYVRQSDHYLGGHAVKILGWGEEDGVKYWLVANSWNTHFGIEGFFKIRRGVDECNIESRIIAGVPFLD